MVRKWIYFLVKFFVVVIMFCALWFFPVEDFADDLTRALMGFGVLVFLECLENNTEIKTKKITPKTWYVVQDGEDFFVTCDCPREGKIYEGDMFKCQGFIDGYKKILNEEMRVCRTCKNPYCSRTLEERRKKNVVVHTQYGWECEDYEKWLSGNGGFAFIKKEKIK